jgi:hypothetical protein
VNFFLPAPDPPRFHVYFSSLHECGVSTFKIEEILLCSRLQVRPDEELVQIYYSALNFRNVVMATGKVAANVFGKDRLKQVRALTHFCPISLVELCNNRFKPSSFPVCHKPWITFNVLFW